LKLTKQADIYTSHSGTFSRFIVAVCALFDDWITLNGSDKMNSRPMADMLVALREAGVQVEATSRETLPLSIKGPISSESIQISGAVSSQYISALLLIGARLPQGLRIELTTEPVSKPYLAMTVDLLSQFGIKIMVSEDYRSFAIAPGQKYQAVSIQIPTDPSSASYFFAYAAISGTHMCLANYEPATSLQGEARFTEVLEKMGCKVWQDDMGFHCQGPEQLQGVTMDMGDMPDVVQTLAVVAAFAEGETHITNIENLAFKESNRIEDTATELRKTGLGVLTSKDSMTIQPAELRPATFDTYDDHRMAMSLGLLASRVRGIRMREPGVVSKSFPDYWRYLAKLGFNTIELE
jgi:3-phosphoshikimate 1-carboxyvinyltransferase